jgi:transcriptional regulator with PAS, ATPase and Fis domain
METILNTIPDGIWVCDGYGKILIINRASEKLNRIDASDYLDHPVSRAVEHGLIDRSVTLDVLKKKCQVSMIQHTKATNKHLLVTGTPAFDTAGEICMVVVNERDITQLNSAKLALEKARQVGEKFKDEVTALNMLELKSNSMVTDSPKMQEILRTGLKMAKQEVSKILLLGESGVGKGVLAKFIHKNSPRSRESFIHINCAALPESLMEAELFGYEKGAFTGANEKGKVGLFELAESGTLFLDEIGDMPLSIQAKLLTYLDDKKILRLGGIEPIKVNCTVIAATNKNLLTCVEQKKFRLDLYYRLNSFTLHIPPLRDRKEDILALTQHFLEKYNQAYGTQRRLSSAAFEQFQSYTFRGNVRELNNIIKKAVVLSEGQLIDDLVLNCLPSTPKPFDFDCHKPKINITFSLEDQIASLEKDILVDAIRRHKTTRRIANFLGTSQSSIMRKIKKYELRIDAGANSI